MPRRPRPAFTLIELLVVVAIIALLISILLPSLQGAREQGKRGKCLANLKGIGTAMQTYSSEDEKEHAIPISAAMLLTSSQVYTGGGSEWIHRTAWWFSWGGRTPPQRFLCGCRGETSPGCGPLLGTDARAVVYAARHRPLNKTLYSGLNVGNDESNLPIYQCPSDSGYPDAPPDVVDDGPRNNAERSLYDTLGNSYRASLYCFLASDGSGAFAIGPWGHRLSTIPTPGRVALVGEPRFFNMVGLNGESEPDPKLLIGWHRRKLTDNLLYVDGSARSTLAAAHEDVPSLPGVGPANAALTARGPTWQFDVYPTHGARIKGVGGTWNPPYTGYGNGISGTQWPFLLAQRNVE